MSKRRILFVVLAILTIFAFAAQAAIVSLGGASDATHNAKLKAQNVEYSTSGDLISIGDIKIRETDCDSDYIHKTEGGKVGTGSVCGGMYKAFTCKSGYTEVGDDCVITCEAGEYYDMTTAACVICPKGSYCVGGSSDVAVKTPAPEGTYIDSEGAKDLSYATDCPDGQYVDVKGSDSIDDCLLCTTGYMNNLDKTGCDTCPCPPEYTTNPNIGECVDYIKAPINSSIESCKGYMANYQCYKENACGTCNPGYYPNESACSACSTACFDDTYIDGVITGCKPGKEVSGHQKYVETGCTGTPTGTCKCCTECDTGYAPDGACGCIEEVIPAPTCPAGYTWRLEYESSASYNLCSESDYTKADNSIDDTWVGDSECGHCVTCITGYTDDPATSHLDCMLGECPSYMVEKDGACQCPDNTYLLNGACLDGCEVTSVAELDMKLDAKSGCVRVTVVNDIFMGNKKIIIPEGKTLRGKMGTEHLTFGTTTGVPITLSNNSGLETIRVSNVLSNNGYTVSVSGVDGVKIDTVEINTVQDNSKGLYLSNLSDPVIGVDIITNGANSTGLYASNVSGSVYADIKTKGDNSPAADMQTGISGYVRINAATYGKESLALNIGGNVAQNSMFNLYTEQSPTFRSNMRKTIAEPWGLSTNIIHKEYKTTYIGEGKAVDIQGDYEGFLNAYIKNDDILSDNDGSGGIYITSQDASGTRDDTFKGDMHVYSDKTVNMTTNNVSLDGDFKIVYSDQGNISFLDTRLVARESGQVAIPGDGVVLWILSTDSSPNLNLDVEFYADSVYLFKFMTFMFTQEWRIGQSVGTPMPGGSGSGGLVDYSRCGCCAQLEGEIVYLDHDQGRVSDTIPYQNPLRNLLDYGVACSGDSTGSNNPTINNAEHVENLKMMVRTGVSSGYLTFADTSENVVFSNMLNF